NNLECLGQTIATIIRRNPELKLINSLREKLAKINPGNGLYAFLDACVNLDKNPKAIRELLASESFQSLVGLEMAKQQSAPQNPQQQEQARPQQQQVQVKPDDMALIKKKIEYFKLRGFENDFKVVGIADAKTGMICIHLNQKNQDYSNLE